MALDRVALDRWIENIPEYEPVLITELNYADYEGKDLRLDERTCERCATSIGWREGLSLIPYWRIDEDGEREWCQACWDMTCEPEYDTYYGLPD